MTSGSWVDLNSTRWSASRSPSGTSTSGGDTAADWLRVCSRTVVARVGLNNFMPTRWVHRCHLMRCGRTCRDGDGSVRSLRSLFSHSERDEERHGDQTAEHGNPRDPPPGMALCLNSRSDARKELRRRIDSQERVDLAIELVILEILRL